jgi:hypothetical protein
MENPHIPQRPTLSIGQHQAFHGRDSCSNPHLDLLKIWEDYLISQCLLRLALPSLMYLQAAFAALGRIVF